MPLSIYIASHYNNNNNNNRRANIRNVEDIANMEEDFSISDREIFDNESVSSSSNRNRNGRSRVRYELTPAPSETTSLSSVATSSTRCRTRSRPRRPRRSSSNSTAISTATISTNITSEASTIDETVYSAPTTYTQTIAAPPDWLSSQIDNAMEDIDLLQSTQATDSAYPTRTQFDFYNSSENADYQPNSAVSVGRSDRTLRRKRRKARVNYAESDCSSEISLSSDSSQSDPDVDDDGDEKMNELSQLEREKGELNSTTRGDEIGESTDRNKCVRNGNSNNPRNNSNNYVRYNAGNNQNTQGSDTSIESLDASHHIRMNRGRKEGFFKRNAKKAAAISNQKSRSNDKHEQDDDEEEEDFDIEILNKPRSKPARPKQYRHPQPRLNEMQQGVATKVNLRRKRRFWEMSKQQNEKSQDAKEFDAPPSFRRRKEFGALRKARNALGMDQADLEKINDWFGDDWNPDELTQVVENEANDETTGQQGAVQQEARQQGAGQKEADKQGAGQQGAGQPDAGQKEAGQQDVVSADNTELAKESNEGSFSSDDDINMVSKGANAESGENAIEEELEEKQPPRFVIDDNLNTVHIAPKATKPFFAVVPPSEGEGASIEITVDELNDGANVAAAGQAESPPQSPIQSIKVSPSVSDRNEAKEDDASSVKSDTSTRAVHPASFRLDLSSAGVFGKDPNWSSSRADHAFYRHHSNQGRGRGHSKGKRRHNFDRTSRSITSRGRRSTSRRAMVGGDSYVEWQHMVEGHLASNRRVTSISPVRVSANVNFSGATNKGASSYNVYRRIRAAPPVRIIPDQAPLVQHYHPYNKNTGIWPVVLPSEAHGLFGRMSERNTGYAPLIGNLYQNSLLDGASGSTHYHIHF